MNKRGATSSIYDANEESKILMISPIAIIVMDKLTWRDTELLCLAAVVYDPGYVNFS
jgi:hypothetical protein